MTQEPKPKGGMGRRALTVAVPAAVFLVGTAMIAVEIAREYLDWKNEDYLSLRAAYGPTHWSHGPEEWIVRDFFQDRREGIFVDVGAADARNGSNTYYLESQLGWSGIAVDAIAEHRPSYVAYRPRTRFSSFVVAERSDREAVVFFEDGSETASVVREFAESYASTKQHVTSRRVPAISLNDLLTGMEVTHIDFLSMDIELSEPMALAGFDLQTFTPALVAVEQHPQVRQQVIDYFVERGYTLVGKYLPVDRDNLWFTPRR